MLIISPSLSARRSGIPWQMISLTELVSTDTRAHAFGIAVVSKRRRVAVALDSGLHQYFVKLVSRHSRANVLCDYLE